MSSIIHNPISTEKAIRLMESENKLLFEVSMNASKPEIKKEVENLFKVKVLKINTFITNKGKKKAYVKLSSETPAMDVATNLGLI